MTKKDWILFVDPDAYPCSIGGKEIFNYYLIKELKKYYSIHILTACKKIDNSNVVVHKLKRLRHQRLKQPLQIFYFIFKNRKSIKIIYLSYSKSSWSYWFVYVVTNFFYGTKYFFTIHGGGMTEWKPKLLYKLFFNNAELITGVSDRIVDEYTRRSGKMISYTPPLIPFNVIRPKNIFRDKWKIKNNEKVLLYVGSLKPLKSVNTLLDALGLISQKEMQKHKLKVLIAGDGISKQDLEKKVLNLKLQNIVSFLGLINRDDISQLYNIADYYTICSEFEGLPISLLEAFANKLPCITSDAPGLKEISLNNKNTLLFKTKNHDDYSKKIHLLLNDKQLQDTLKKNAFKYYNNNFSHNFLINYFKKFIDKVD